MLGSQAAEDAKLPVLLALALFVRRGRAESDESSAGETFLRLASGERFEIEREGIKRIRKVRCPCAHLNPLNRPNLRPVHSEQRTWRTKGLKVETSVGRLPLVGPTAHRGVVQLPTRSGTQASVFKGR